MVVVFLNNVGVNNSLRDSIQEKFPEVGEAVRFLS